MSSLRERLQMTREDGLLEPWERTAARFAAAQAAAQTQRKLRLVASHVWGSAMERVSGVIEGTQLAGLLGPPLRTELLNWEWEADPVTTISIVSAACALNVENVELTDTATTVLAGKLRGIHRRYELPMYPAERGLCGVYFGLDDVWQSEADVPWNDDYAFEPGRSFGGNVRGLMAYLGAATLRGADFEDVEPALHNFITTFDSLWDADFVQTSTLLLVGIVAVHSVGGLPKEQTLDWFGRYLCWAVGLDDDKPEWPGV